MPGLLSSNKNFLMTVKIYAEMAIKVFCSCPVLFDFCSVSNTLAHDCTIERLRRPCIGYQLPKHSSTASSASNHSKTQQIEYRDIFVILQNICNQTQVSRILSTSPYLFPLNNKVTNPVENVYTRVKTTFFSSVLNFSMVSQPSFTCLKAAMQTEYYIRNICSK